MLWLQRQVQRQEVEAITHLEKLAETQQQVRPLASAKTPNSDTDLTQGNSDPCTIPLPPAISQLQLVRTQRDQAQAELKALQSERAGEMGAGTAAIDQDQSSGRPGAPCAATEGIDVKEQEGTAAKLQMRDAVEREGERKVEKEGKGEREMAEKARDAREVEMDEQVTFKPVHPVTRMLIHFMTLHPSAPKRCITAVSLRVLYAQVALLQVTLNQLQVEPLSIDTSSLRAKSWKLIILLIES